MTDGLTIGQAAAYADVTIKTVRHYHRLGLIDEPSRDSSGYRRYCSSDLLRLVQVRTLAGAGVPLVEIGELLDAGPERLTTALEEVERVLTDRIDELVARRVALRRLAAGEQLLLPDRADAALHSLAALGFSAEHIALQREAMVLARAVVPEFFDGFVRQLEHQLADPEYVVLMRRCSEVRDPDDPRIEELAAGLAEKMLADPDLLAMPAEFRTRPDAAARYGLINHHREDAGSAAARLTSLIEAKLRTAGVEVPAQ